MKNKGFTLIELLVAAVILFSVVASVSLIYRGAFIASEKASNHVQLVTAVAPLLGVIQDEIRSNRKNTSQLSGQGQAWQVNYQWQASAIQNKKIIDKSMSIQFGEASASSQFYTLWQGELTISLNGVIQQYQFNEVSWRNE